MPALDAVKAFWILGIFLCMFFWLPTRLFSGRPNFSAVICMAGNWARMVLCVTIFVFLLSGLKVFGAITVVLLFLGAIIVSWFRKRTGMSRRLLTNLQATTINLIRHFESRSFGRFLTPAIGLLLVLATGLLVQVSARAGVASVAAMYCLGAAGFPPAINQTGAAVSTTGKMETIFSASPATIRPSPEFAVGLLFLLLALVFLADWYRNSRGWDSLLDFTCCLLLTAMVSEVLLVILVLAAGVLLLRPMAGLFALVMLCYGLVAWASLSAGIHIPDEMRTILPVAAAILVGCALAFIKAPLVARTGRTTATVLLAACLGVAVIWLRPQRFVGRCLEYEAAARATQEIAYSFPRQTWVEAAPVEQLAETFGLGGHEDLAGFVQNYRSQVSSPRFHFPDARQDLFIYVEKRPFQIFSREPEKVSFSVLSDPTYRNYRSPGGRASLEAAALQLCENYRQHHSNVDVFFENEVLRIYHIHQQQASASVAGH